MGCGLFFAHDLLGQFEKSDLEVIAAGCGAWK